MAVALEAYKLAGLFQGVKVVLKASGLVVVQPDVFVLIVRVLPADLMAWFGQVLWPQAVFSTPAVCWAACNLATYRFSAWYKQKQ